MTKMADTRNRVMRAVLRKSCDLCGADSAENEETKVCDMRPISRNLWQKKTEGGVYDEKRDW